MDCFRRKTKYISDIRNQEPKIHPGFEIQGRCHQNSEIRVLQGTARATHVPT